MNAYIFITMSICGIGGSEQYIYNKSQFLKKNNYDVFVFSGMTRPVLIAGLKQYEYSIIPAVMYAPWYYRKSEIDETLSFMENEASQKNYERIVIESDGIDEAKWGELLAKRLNAKHIIFNVQEVHNYTDKEKEFLNYKLSRNELFGISASSVGQMLGREAAIPNTQFSAFCNNVVQDCEDNYSSLLNADADYTIASIGRLEKSCVLPMLEEMALFVTQHSLTRFNILLIGGSSEAKVIEQIRKTFAALHNVTLIITGSLYPIPRSLVHKANVFVSTAGSAAVSHMEEIPTIKIHPITGRPCGLIGDTFDYFKGSMYDVLEGVSISDLLEEILLCGKVPTFTPDLLKNYENRMNSEFYRQLRIAEADYSNTYFDVFQLKYSITGKKRMFYYLLGKTIGGKGMQVVLEELRHILK